MRRPSEKVPTAAFPTISPLAMLLSCDGYYDCPKGSSGRRGPLMGYAGTYDDEASGSKKQFVGDVYYNFSQAEQLPNVLDWFAGKVEVELKESGFSDFDCVLGAPMGGIALAQMIAIRMDRQFVFAEKKTTALATADSREKSKLVLSRHVIEPGARILWVEDVCNNFSTTDEGVQLVESKGAKLVAITCAINRSGHLQRKGIPVFSPAFLPTEQFRQDDPLVAEDIARGNVFWKPKDEWTKVLTFIKRGKGGRFE